MKAKQYQREDRSFFEHCLIMNCDKSGKSGAPRALHTKSSMIPAECCFFTASVMSNGSNGFQGGMSPPLCIFMPLI